SSTVRPTLFAGRLTPNFGGDVTALGSEVPDPEAFVDSESSGGFTDWTDCARRGWRAPDTHPPQSDTLTASTTRERQVPTENRRLSRPGAYAPGAASGTEREIPLRVPGGRYLLWNPSQFLSSKLMWRQCGTTCPKKTRTN